MMKAAAGHEARNNESDKKFDMSRDGKIPIDHVYFIMVTCT